MRNFIDDLYDNDLVDGDGTISREREYITLRFNALVVPSLEDRFCVHDLHRKKVNATNVFIVPVGLQTLTEGLMACILDEDVQSFDKMEKGVQIYGESTDSLGFVDPHLPIETELCVALVQGKWRRCMFIELLGSSKMGRVFALDYGIIASVEVDDIRRMCSQIVQFPVVTLICDVQQASKVVLGQHSRLLCKSIQYDEQQNVHLLELH